MSDSPGLSRRGLFGFGLSRIVSELDELEQVKRTAVGGSEPDREPAPPDLREQSARLHAAWGRSEHADLWAPAAEALLDRALPRPEGMHLLDAGAGDGAVALAAALRGAAVTACDWSAPVVAGGHERTAEAGAQVEWVEADMAALPFADASFDHVLSGFAPMFCLDFHAALAELFRVVRPGGTVAFTVWTAGGAVGRLLRMAAIHDPPAPGARTPLSAGRGERLRQDLLPHADRPRFSPGTIGMRFASREEAVQRLLRALGPLAAAHELAPLDAEVEAIVDELADAGPGPVGLESTYLIAVAQRG